MMQPQEFFDLCIEKTGDMFVFPEFDTTCLHCRWRIGSHGRGEFERCAKNYKEEE